eukprot:44278-Pyramimonas_sp.AAC.1
MGAHGSFARAGDRCATAAAQGLKRRPFCKPNLGGNPHAQPLMSLGGDVVRILRARRIFTHIFYVIERDVTEDDKTK